MDPQLDRPIIILGAPRSGTTILGSILNQHPDVAYLVEPRFTWRYGNDCKSDMLRPENARPKVIKHIRSKLSDFVQQRNKKRLVEKTPSNSLRPGFVNQVLPECRFIHIIRNGYDACLATSDFWDKHASGLTGLAEGRLIQRLRELGLRRIPYYAAEFARRSAPSWLQPLIGKNAWGPRIPAIQSLTRELNDLEISCLQWRFCVEISCHYGKQLPKNRYMEIRLEDFSSKSFKEILDFCELDNTPEIERFIDQNFDATRTGARQLSMNPNDAATIQRLAGNTLMSLGYQNGQNIAARHT